jgi:FkbM family methyltransferase
MDSIALGAALVNAGPLRIKRCRRGLMLFSANDRYLGRSLDLYGEFSEGEAGLFAHMLRPGMVAVDIGANIGPHTLVLAHAVGPSGLVIAVEPQRLIYQMLCANLALNTIANVRALQVAAGSKRTTSGVPVLDYSSDNNFGGVSLTTTGANEPVDVISIDGMGLSACHFMKIDVEGMEGEVLAGAEETIGRHRPILYVENDRPDKSASLIAQLLRFDYRLYSHTPPLFNAANFFQNARNEFPGIVSHNMLSIPRESKNQPGHAREVFGPDDWQLA